MLEALCRSSGTTLDSVHAEDGPPITQRTSGLVAACITCFFAYRSARHSVEVANHRLAGTLLIHLNRRASSDVVDEQKKAQYDGANSQASLATRDTKCAVVSGITLVLWLPGPTKRGQGLSGCRQRVTNTPAQIVLGALIGGWTLIMFSGGTS